MMLNAKKQQTTLQLGDVMIFHRKTSTISFTRSNQEEGNRLYWQLDESNGPRDKVQVYTAQDADTMACMLAGACGFKFLMASNDDTVTYIFEGR